MSQFGFYVSSVGFHAGFARFDLAWDPYDGGPQSGMGVTYDAIGVCGSASTGRLRNMKPVKCTAHTGELDLCGKGRVLHFKIDPTGALTVGGFVKITFQVFDADDNSKLIYDAASSCNQSTLNVQVKGVLTGGFEFLGTIDREDDQGLFGALLTVDGPTISLPFGVSI